MRRTWSVLGALVLATLFSLALQATPGLAHRASHPFESVLGGISPESLGTGIEIEMLDSDSRIRLQNDSGRPVVVEGYEGEPYARLDPSGSVSLNSRSPAFYLNNDRYAKTPVDPEADPRADPSWIWISDSGELTWFDRRSHYMGTGTPPGLDDPSERTEMRRYRIPLRIGGHRAVIDGTLYWTGSSGFPMVAVAGLLVVTFLGAGFSILMIRRMRREPE